jgi:hypothetical protein
MARFTGTGPVAIQGETTDTNTTPDHPIGTEARDKDGNVYTYIKAGAAIAQYDAVRFAGSALGWDDVRPTSAAGQCVIGAAQAAIASASYGWILTRGIATVKVVNSTAAGGALVPNATAGTLAVATAADVTFSRAVCLVTGVSTGSAVAFA